MAAFLTAAAAAIGESGIGGAIVRILVAYGISRLINGSTGSNNSSTAPIDKGVRLQLQPDTTNPVPLVYGSTYLGAKVTDAQITDANKTMWYCLTICETTDATKLSGGSVVNTINEIYMNNSRVVLESDGVTVNHIYTEDPNGTISVDKNPQGLVQIYLFNNGSASPVLPTDAPTGATVPTADARTLMPGWTNDHRMTNLTFALIKLTYNSSKGITALPTFQFKVENELYLPGDVIYDYLTRSISGAGLDSSVIDTASLTALNAYSIEETYYIDPITFQPDSLPRYKINGLVDPSKTVFTNLQSMVNASGSFINYDITSGKWNVIINKDNSPVLNFNDSNILGGITVTGTSLDQIYNSVEVSYPHRELQSQQDTVRIDIPRDGNSFLNPNEPKNILKITYDLVDEPLQALELGYIELYQNRMDQVITFTTDYSMFQVEAADVITITNSIYGWDHKQFRVIRVREIESDQGGLALEITAQEYDSYIYTAKGTPIRPGVPIGPGVPPIGVIGTPAAPTVTSTNNIAIPAVTIHGVSPSGIVDRFEFWISTDNDKFSLLGTDINSNGEIFNQGTGLTYTTFTLAAGTYYFQVRGANQNAVGAFSSSSTSFTWAPVASVNPNSSIDPGQSGLSSLLPLLGIGALAYLGYKYLYPELLSALSDTQLGKLLGIEDPTKVAETKAALDSAATNFKLVQVGTDVLIPAVRDTLEFAAGDGITLSADEATNTITITNTLGAAAEIKTFKVIKTDGQPDIVAGTAADTLTFVAGTGITITQDAGTNTITIGTGSSGGGGGGGGSGGGGSGGATSNANYGNASKNFKLDNCEVIQYKNARTKTIKHPGYYIDSKQITGGDTYTDNCFPYTFPVLIVPNLGINIGYDPVGNYSAGGQTHAYPAETPSGKHPWQQGGYDSNGNAIQLVSGFSPVFNSAHSALTGKVIKYKVIASDKIIAYCDFDDNGNPLAVNGYEGSTCSTDPSARQNTHPVFGTTEFPVNYYGPGLRFVTYEKIQTWCGGTGPYNMNQRFQQATTTETKTFTQEPVYLNHSRYCVDSNEPSMQYT
jgi:hypothetical protein